MPAHEARFGGGATTATRTPDGAARRGDAGSDSSDYNGRCECPCHHGGDVFHIVSCCGSVLGRGRRASYRT